MDSNDNTPQWAVIELMGHNRYGGLVSKDTAFGTAMLRIDVPQDDKFITQLINPSSLYRITLCEETIARAAAQAGNPRPMHSWELPKALPAAESAPEDDDGREEY